MNQFLNLDEMSDNRDFGHKRITIRLCKGNEIACCNRDIFEQWKFRWRLGNASLTHFFFLINLEDRIL